MSFSRQPPIFQQFQKPFDRNQNGNLIEISVREPDSKDFLNELSQQTTHAKEEEKTELHVLSKEELTKLYKRLPPIQEEKDDKKEFSMRQSTLPAPKTGDRVLQQFPPKNELEKPKVLVKEDDAHLKILRYLPEGKVKMAPHLSVTFNHPMIALSSVENVESQEVPIKIEPHPKGRFKWIGTKTVLFEPEYRFPMATEYKVTIPAGTTSQNGKKMKDAFSFSFSTAPPSVVEFLPANQTVNNQPICFLKFDQTIDKEKALHVIKLVDSKQNEYPLQIVTEDYVREVLKQQDTEKKLPHLYNLYSSALKNAKPERSFWFTVKRSLPLANKFTLIVGPNVISLEGPLPSIHPQNYQFYTYNALVYTSHYPTQNITPNQQWTISFSNEIELDTFTDDIVTVHPPLPDLEITPFGQNISIYGRSKGRTNYTVTISTKLQDVYGQYLQKEEKVQFNVGNANQSLQSFAPDLITLDPTLSEEPTFSVVTCNVEKIRVVLLQVQPTEFAASRFGRNYQRNFRKKDHDSPLQYVGAGKIIVDEIVSPNGKPDEPVETFIKLERALQHKAEKLGQVVVYVEPEQSSWNALWDIRPIICSWIQITKLAFDAFITPGRLYCFSNSLVNGASLPGVTFTTSNNKTAKSDETGMAVFEEFMDSPIIACLDKDCSFLPTIRRVEYPKSSCLGFFFDDRKMYKPKETVNVKGIIRLLEMDVKSGTRKLRLPKEGTPVQYIVRDARGNKINEGQAQLNEFGSFALKFDLPDNINLGTCSIAFQIEGTNFRHNFSCQEFRTPEYSVKSDVPPGPHVVNGTTVVTTTANYYSGGGLSGADINWTIKQRSANYSPPGWNGFVFQEQPDIFDFCNVPSVHDFGNRVTLIGKTDSSGVHKACVEFKETARKDKLPVTITAESNVTDINRQMISSSTSFLVHPSNFYVGIKNPRGYAKPKEALPLEFIVTDIDGNAVEDIIIKFTITKKERKRKGYKWFTEDVHVKDGVIASKDKPVTYDLILNEGGRFALRAEISDKTGLSNNSKIPIFVQGGKFIGESGRALTKERVTLIPDKKSYEPGQTADILIQSPFDGPSEGVAYLICDTVVHQERFSLNGLSHVLQVPIKKEYIPQVKLFVYIVGQNNRVDESGNIITDEKVPKRPAYASGEINLSVPPHSYHLSVKVTPSQQFVTPGASTEVVVSVQNANKPVKKSEVTLIVVDEAILSLTGYSLSNPLDYFHRARFGSMRDLSLRSSVHVKDWKNITFSAPIREDFAISQMFTTMASNDSFGGNKMMLRSKMVGNALGEVQGEKPAIMVRSNFSPLAAFESHLITNEDGIAKAMIKLPDNLTRYRIMALALYDCNYYGLGESFLVANLPLMIRPSPPRFLNFGDKCNVSVVLQNQTNKPLEINIAMRTSNLSLQDNEKAGYKLTLHQSKRVEVSFPVETQNAGIARVQFGAEVVNGDFADAAEVKIPIWTPATTEGFATYGEIDTGSIVQPIMTPDEVFTQFGGLKITTSSTALQALTDAFLYLLNYEYDCSEPIASRLLSIVALEDILGEFKASEIPTKEELKKYVENGLKKIYACQKHSGAFGFWPSSTYTSPYVSIHVALCLARVNAKGYSVRADVLKKSQNYLMTIENYIRDYHDDPFTRNTLRSMALYVLTVMKVRNNIVYEKTKQLFNESGLDKISMEGLSWIAFALYHSSPHPKKEDAIAKILKYFANRVNETAGTANFITSYGEKTGKMVMLHSNRRTDAIILETLLLIDSKNTLIPKIVKGLLAHRKKGRWSSTQENCYILVALEKYFHLFESQTPDFVARLWLGDGFIGEQTFKGRNTDENVVDIPMNYVITGDEKTKPLLISKEGKGRLYYRIGMDYAPKNLKLPSSDYGFIIERKYEPITNPEHVKRDKDGIWHIKSGEMVRVRLTISTNSRRYHVAVVDKLPGGLEPMNPELKGTASIPLDPKNQERPIWFGGAWYEHQNLRDERVEAFTSLLWAGIYEYSFVGRATTLGKFVVPPAKAEEMYAPEIFGRSDTDFVIIE